MKKLIVFLILFSSLAHIYSKTYEGTQFDVVLSKPGITEYYFSDSGHENHWTIPVFIIQNADSPTKAGANVSFVWNIYTDSTISMVMDFFAASDLDRNESTTGYMLRNAKDASSGLNYDVNITGRSNADSAGNISTGSSSVGLSSRQITLVENQKVDSVAGISGWVDLSLIVDAAKHTTKGAFMEGQYKGYICVRVLSS